LCPCVVSFLPLLPLPPLTLSTDVAPATKWNVLQLIDCSPLRSIPITGTSSLLWALLTSHSSLLLRLMRPPVRPPRLRCTLFPLIYLPHLLVLPATFGLHRLLPTYPYFPALYVVPVRQAKGLPTASFRFHLAMDTLAVQLCTSSLPTRTRDFHPLERAHGAQTEKTDTFRHPFSVSMRLDLNQRPLRPEFPKPLCLTHANPVFPCKYAVFQMCLFPSSCIFWCFFTALFTKCSPGIHQFSVPI